MKLTFCTVCMLLCISDIECLNRTVCEAANGAYNEDRVSCFLFVNSPTTWAQSRTNCRLEKNANIISSLQVRYSRLAYPQDSATFDLLRNYLSQQAISQDIWIGFCASDTVPMCQWYEPSRKDTSIDVIPANMILPPNSPVNNQSCTAVSRKCAYISVDPFSLNFDAQTTSRGYICEYSNSSYCTGNSYFYSGSNCYRAYANNATWSTAFSSCVGGKLAWVYNTSNFSTDWIPSTSAVSEFWIGLCETLNTLNSNGEFNNATYQMVPSLSAARFTIEPNTPISAVDLQTKIASFGMSASAFLPYERNCGILKVNTTDSVVDVSGSSSLNPYICEYIAGCPVLPTYQYRIISYVYNNRSASASDYMVTNTKAVFSCSTLYSLIDTTAQVVLQQSQPYLTCTIDSQWNGSGVNLICQRLCDDFNITYGNVSYRNNLYYHSPNDTASVTCFQSYRLEGPGVHTCLNGVWSPPINTTTCLPPCTSLLSNDQTISHGQIAYNPAAVLINNTSFYLDATIATIICDDAYLLSGSNQSTCINSSWNRTLPECLAPCSPLSLSRQTVLSSSISYQMSATNSLVSASSISFPSSTKVTIVCSSSYTMLGENTSVCTNGTWSKSVGECQAPCSSLVLNNQTLSNSQVNYDQSGISLGGLITSSIYPSLTSVTITCNAYYFTLGESTSSCNNGTWSAAAAECLAPCTSMLPTANSLNVTMGLHNSTATVTCLPSYQLLNVSANKTHFRCNNGTWTSISGVPTCDLIKVENGSTVAGQSDPMTKCEALAAAVLQSFGSATVISATWFSLGLFLVMRVFTLERCLHMCQELTLSVAHIIILTSIDKLSEISCRLVLTVLNYLFNCLFIFVFLECLQTYCVMTNVVCSGGFFSLKLNLAIGWGIPVIPSILYGSLMLPSQYSCWINYGSSVHLLSTLPLFALSIASIVITEASALHVWRKLPKSEPAKILAANISQKMFCKIAILNCASWFLGSYAIYKRIFGLYPNCYVINTLLAVFMAMAHISSDKKVHQVAKNITSKVKTKILRNDSTRSK